MKYSGEGGTGGLLKMKDGRFCYHPGCSVCGGKVVCVESDRTAIQGHFVMTQTYYCSDHRPKYGVFSLEAWEGE